MHNPRTLHLFAGAGGGILADIILGHQPVCAVEINAYCQQVLSARQKDGFLPWFPIFDDVTTFDGKPWAGLVDVVCGGFPCQDISAAGRGDGLDGERSGLWKEFARIIGEVRPRYAFIENSPMLTTRGLDRVLCDLAALGFDAEWGVISAADTGAFHIRERIWIVANAKLHRISQRRGIEDAGKDGKRSHRIFGDVRQGMQQQEMAPLADANSGNGKRVFGGGVDSQDRQEPGKRSLGLRGGGRCQEWPIEPDVGRVVNGLASRVDRIKALGNGQVPRVAAAAFDYLSRRAGFK